MCNRCSGWVHSKCSGLQNEYRRIKNWACISCSSPPTPQIPKPLPSPTTTKASDGDPFTILQFNANGIGNKQVELGDFLERHKVKVAVIQELKLTLNFRTPNIQNFITVRKDRDQGQGGSLLTLIHKSINFSWRPDSPDTLADPHLEELTITAKLGNTDFIITNVYISPSSSCTGGYNTSLDHLMMTTDTLILGNFNAHHSSWYSSSTPDVSLASASLITSNNWQTKTNLDSDHLPILISLIQHRTSINLKKANWDRYSREIEDKLSKRRLPTDCQKGERSCVPLLLKQHHTTYPLDDTKSTQSRFQQRYWKR